MTLELLKTIIAAFALSLPPVWYPAGAGPETVAQRDARVEMASHENAEQAHSGETRLPPDQLAAMTESIWFNESRFDWHVHAGKVSPIGNQDVGNARCLGQVQTWRGNTLLTRAEWLALTGLDRAATRRCAAATQSYLWYHAQRCIRRDVPAARRWDKRLTDHEAGLLFAAYGAGNCAPIKKSTGLRIATYRQLMAAIRRGATRKQEK